MDADQPPAPGISGLPQLPRPLLLNSYNSASTSTAISINTLQLRPPPPLQNSFHDASQAYSSGYPPQHTNEYVVPAPPQAERTSVSSSFISNGSSVNMQIPITQPKRKAGRPRDTVADSIAHEVKRQNAPPIFRCNYCEATWAHYNPYRVKKHGLDCKGMPEDMRIRLAQEVTLKNSEHDPHKRAKTDGKHQLSIHDQKLLESFLIESIATAGMPISAIFHSSVRRLFQYSSPSFVLPSRHALLKSILPSEIDTVRAKVTTTLQQGGDLVDSLTLSFDVLTTAFDQSYVYIYATTRTGRTYCLSGHEFPDHPPAADELATVIMTDMERIGCSKFVAVVAPKLNIFTSAAGIITSRYPHLLALEQLDHYVDQLAADLCRHPALDGVIKTMRLIYVYFHRYGRAEGLLRARMNELRLNEGLKPLVVHEPISLYTAAVSMRRCLPALISVVSNDRQKLDKTTNKRQVCDVLSPESWLHGDFVSKLEVVIAVLKPLSEASTCINAATATLADVFISWVAIAVYYRDLFVACSTPSPPPPPPPTTTTAATLYIVPDLRQHIVVQTNLRFSQQFNTFPRAASSLTLAMFLHPTMALHDVLIKSPDQRSRVVHELYAQMSMLNDPTRSQQQFQQHNTILYDDLAKFRHRVDIYARQSVGSPHRYWAEVWEAAVKTCCQTGTILPRIAKRLFEINGSNMRRPRVRETLDWIDASLRDNLSSDLMLGLMQCRHFYIVERANEAEGRSATGLFGESASDDGADSDHGGQSAGSGGVDPFDFDFEVEIEYMRDPHSRLVQRLEDESPVASFEVESAPSGSGSGTGGPYAPGTSQMYAAAAGPPQSPSLAIAGVFDTTSTATSTGSPRSAATSVAPTTGTAGLSTAASQDHIFEVEKHVVLDNFRRTGYCFEMPFGSSASTGIANAVMANMQIPQFGSISPYPQPYSSNVSYPVLSQPQTMYPSVSYSRSYRTQSAPQLQYNNDVSTLLPQQSTSQTASRQSPAPQQYYTSGPPQQSYHAAGSYGVPPLRRPTSASAPSTGETVPTTSSSVAASQTVATSSAGKPEWSEMQRFPDNFEL
ncbi:hypothetical protein V1517DRAFT_109726 [Lipomyces orientalis]|uniref:Uncharacterized protein n=1 Tax=Lipomyces orientalis TaxID=1233043 RepID=A0ACC3TQ67_9ASCO